MQTTKPKGPQLARPGPIGVGIRVLLGATTLYWFAALLTKWSGFVERDPIESGRLYTLFTIWSLPEVEGVVLFCADRPAPSLVVGQVRAKVLVGRRPAGPGLMRAGWAVVPARPGPPGMVLPA
jgi:hypothetical protein